MMLLARLALIRTCATIASASPMSGSSRSSQREAALAEVSMALSGWPIS